MPAPGLTPSPQDGSACPSDAALLALLQDALAVERVSQLSTHLEICSVCRHRLESLAGAEQVLPASPIPPPPRSSHALAAVMAQLRRSDSTHLDAEPLISPATLDLLAPPVTSGTLGRFAGYDVLERIASGGMGIVFKAHDPGLNRVVAIKILAPFLAASDSARARFLREARAAAAISHEHVVAIHAVGEERGLPFLVMQFIAGRSLESRLRAGQLEPAQILRIGRQTAQGLAAAHSQGLIHRDVKPGNILLENGVERVKLTDFGLARAADEPGVTRPGVLAGTPEFMSPEQARGARIDHRSDLFALGSVLYLMATGRSPFAAETTIATLRRVCDDHPARADSLNPCLPSALGDLIEDLLAKAPDRRPPSSEEVANALGEMLSALQSGKEIVSPRTNEGIGEKDPDGATANPTRSRRDANSPQPTSPAATTRQGAPFLVVGLALAALVTLVALVMGRMGGRAQPSDPTPPSPTASNSLVLTPAIRLAQSNGETATFTNLAAALAHATSGSTLDLDFTGRLEIDPVRISGKNLRLRAAPGQHPVLASRAGSEVMIGSDSVLVLEGLELRSAFADTDTVQDAAPMLTARRLLGRRFQARENKPEPALIQMRAGELWLANCRLVTSTRRSVAGDAVFAGGTARIEIVNSEFYVLGGASFWWRRRVAGEEVNVQVSNSVFFASAPFTFSGPRMGAIEIQATRCTLLGGVFASSPDRVPMALELADSLVAMRGVFPPTPGGELLPHLTLREHGNLFSTRAPGSSPGEGGLRPGANSAGADLDFGLRRHSTTETGRRLELADFQPIADPAARNESLAGRGADLSLVGPGSGLERWRASPATTYTDWQRTIDARLR